MQVIYAESMSEVDVQECIVAYAAYLRDSVSLGNREEP